MQADRAAFGDARPVKHDQRYRGSWVCSSYGAIGSKRGYHQSKLVKTQVNADE